MRQQDIKGLAIDCTAGRLVVAAGCGDQIIAENSFEEPHGHAAVLMALIQDVLASARATISDLAFIAVNCGPGSFTGVRVGLSAAIGVGLARGIPVYGINAMDVVAAQAESATGDIVAIVDGRRAEFFYQRFSVDRKPLMEVTMALPEDIEKALKPSDHVVRTPPSITSLYRLAEIQWRQGIKPEQFPSAFYVREPDVSLPKKHTY